jgi:hypothetical protein
MLFTVVISFLAFLQGTAATPTLPPPTANLLFSGESGVALRLKNKTGEHLLASTIAALSPVRTSIQILANGLRNIHLAPPHKVEKVDDSKSKLAPKPEQTSTNAIILGHSNSYSSPSYLTA